MKSAVITGKVEGKHSGSKPGLTNTRSMSSNFGLSEIELEPLRRKEATFVTALKAHGFCFQDTLTSFE